MSARDDYPEMAKLADVARTSTLLIEASGMLDEIDRRRDEVEDLRSLLAMNGIDPDQEHTR